MVTVRNRLVPGVLEWDVGTKGGLPCVWQCVAPVGLVKGLGTSSNPTWPGPGPWHFFNEILAMADH